MDQKIKDFIVDLMDLKHYNISNSELEEFLFNRKEEGGLELMTPGKYFDLMYRA